MIIYTVKSFPIYAIKQDKEHEFPYNIYKISIETTRMISVGKCKESREWEWDFIKTENTLKDIFRTILGDDLIDPLFNGYVNINYKIDTDKLFNNSAHIYCQMLNSLHIKGVDNPKSFGFFDSCKCNYDNMDKQ